MEKVLGLLLACAVATNGLYAGSKHVVELTASNFKSKVLDSDEFWLVKFYSPNCGHCVSMAAEFEEAAESLQGIANLGAVDMTKHSSIGGPYNIRGFPTIKIFGFDKQNPKDYQGSRTASAFTDTCFKEIRRMSEDRKNGKKGRQSRNEDDSGSSGEEASVTLTEDNFQKLVVDSDEPWIVEFYAPWCGHCKRLEPEWKAAARELKEKIGDSVRMGAVDATAHQYLGSKYGVQGYPTIKVFKKGSKDKPEDFQGGRDKSSIVQAAMELHEINIEPPEIKEIVSNQVVSDACIGKQLCVLAFLPNILDNGGAKGRNEKLKMLTAIGDHFKKQIWGWLWTEAGKHPKLEKSLRIGGAGYPALAVIVDKKKMYSVLTGPFTKDGIETFLNYLTHGRGGRNSDSLDGDKLPEVEECEPWDGKDGKLPEEEDVDLSDFKWDDEL